MGAGWNFDNSYARLPEIMYTRLNPKTVRSPQLCILNDQLAGDLGLDITALRSDEGVAVFGGNRIPEGASPLAQAYAGHQFGHFNMLGDGRALLLGEQVTPQGKRVDIQLKGSGPTPYSRRGDGRAALGPMLREYIISEAMHALGIPTTRSLAVVATGELIYREDQLPGAILTRVASSHLRVGTFQYAANWGNVEQLRTLADYTIQRHYPYIETDDNRYLSLLHEVIKRQAELIAKWQLVGFIHGVMNTDNMALSGETIDYGPCAFMDDYDPATVFSSIDTQGRYAYGNQPPIAGWNLARFAEALLPLLHSDETEAIAIAENALAQFAQLYSANWLTGMRSKLGIFNEEPEDAALIEELLAMLQKYRADYTNTFRELSVNEMRVERGDESSDDRGDSLLYRSEDFTRWRGLWQARLSRQQQSAEDSRNLMRSSNPTIIPRNHRVEEALQAAVEQGDYSVMERLLVAISHPYENSPEQADYMTPPSKSSQPYRTFCGT
ncbi:MAG: YdiU family protein [Candidatus Cohnella colombiensis]|uniref:Protein nucleotidyltransferase YdiU n=1 Tax=Candidatus Cohnella colombiensis TaxID=3121368 RepID=A0AA95JCP8_9BACL|nr:MAG: YdiU family protein [Cohnella sp.]